MKIEEMRFRVLDFCSTWWDQIDVSDSQTIRITTPFKTESGNLIVIHLEKKDDEFWLRYSDDQLRPMTVPNSHCTRFADYVFVDHCIKRKVETPLVGWEIHEMLKTIIMIETLRGVSQNDGWEVFQSF